jgi:hypothetical protein
VPRHLAYNNKAAIMAIKSFIVQTLYYKIFHGHN